MTKGLMDDEIDLARGTENVAKILGGATRQATPEEIAEAQRRTGAVSAEALRAAGATMPRRKRSDAGKPRVPTGLLQVKFTIEPEDGFAIVEWMTRHGYAECAKEVLTQLGKYWDDLRLSE